MKALIPALVLLPIIVAANTQPLPYRPPLYGLGFFLWGMSMWPLARQQKPVPFERFLVEGGHLAFSRYAMVWGGLSILMASLSGVLFFA